MQTYFTVGVQETAQSTTLYVEGELDLASSPHLADAITRARGTQPPLVVVDLGKLHFMDMAGLRVLLSAHQEAEREGTRLVLANLRSPVRRLLDLAQVSDVMPVLDWRTV